MAEENTNKSAPRRRGPGGPGMRHSTDKAKDFKGTLKKFLSYVAKYKISLAVVVIFAIGSTVFTIVGPKVLSKAITELFNGLTSKYLDGGAIDFEKIAMILLTLLALYLVATLFSMIQGWVMTTISQKVGYTLREEISEKIHRMPMKYFEGNSIGDVLSRITNDVDTLGQNFNQSVSTLVTSVTSIVGVTIMMLTISPLMTLVVFAMLPLSVLIIAVIMKFSQKYFFRQQKLLGKVNGQVEEDIAGHNILKLFNHEKQAEKEFNETNEELYKSAWKSQFFSVLMMPIINFISNLGFVGVAIFGGVLAFKGSITVGDIQAFIQYSRNFTQPITQLAQIGSMLQGMAAAAERVFEFLGEEEEISDEDGVELGVATGHVEFEHVKFGYKQDQTIIKDLTESVPQGSTVAIVGPTGAGKTTLVKLLMRFYDVGDGAIIVDGHDIKTIRRASLRQNFGMVLQDTWLFKGTIMDNIRYGRPDATDEEVYEAAKAAHVHHFIKTLPGSYHMELTEDAENISQGQKQLLTIARAILADSPILILDEATSSVDTRTEELIQKAMQNLKHGRTSFVIAHRLSTIRDADIILVMNEGDVIEQGTHDELMALDGFYANLYNSQFDVISDVIA
ncbi:MAG: ABC transporter ATP-binding protein/permease [Clostridiales Family XIII bacterium]|nr:ABC transporter ATP-binding protein/permease [Clostridiales Family XIII bacterium]